MKIVKKVVSIIISIVLWGIILLAALYAFTTLATKGDGDVKRLFGITPMTVQTDSMAPTFESGDLIFIKKCDTDSLVEGDIITFHTIIDNQYALNTHRINTVNVENGLRSYVTKGDNNDMTDTHIISDGDIVGVYMFRVKGLGKVMDFLSGSLGFLLIIVLPLLLFFIYQIYHLVMVSINLKKAIAAEAVLESEVDAEDKIAEAKKAKAEAEAELEEARRMKAEAEALKAEAEAAKADAKNEDKGE